MSSNPSKYSGLAGTVLLGTLLGLNYTQYAKRKSPLADKGPGFVPEDHMKPGSLFDKKGNVIPLGQTNLPGVEYVRSIRHRVPDNSPLVLCLVLSTVWAVRSFVAMNRVLNRRYSDVVYQIRRPDVIANRLRAWQILGVGGAVVPVMAALSAYWYLGTPHVEHNQEVKSALRSANDNLRNMVLLNPIQPDKSSLANAVSEFGKTLRSGIKPF